MANTDYTEVSIRTVLGLSREEWSEWLMEEMFPRPTFVRKAGYRKPHIAFWDRHLVNEWGVEFRKCSIHRIPRDFFYRMKRISRNSKIEFLVDRDGEVCGICQEVLDFELGIHIDHIHPKSKGGSDKLENLQLAHPKCNLQKSDSIA